MAAITSAIIAIAGVVLGWIAIEIACKPCLEKGRDAIDRSLNPDYDPDDDNNDVRAPLNPDREQPNSNATTAASSDAIKSV
ncbi:outer envelope membrane protein 7 [Mangifera indica]|uniref:outer envelope membrane protein 7 n=1 Tax=Mangifera indica TaxID=29780 RepID=UPI001CFAABCD|nr:outer envelope membrane protein 7 [Mangifera indica]